MAQIKITMNANHDKEKLEQFFRTVADLTSNHDVLSDRAGGYAVVWPKDLGKALEKVDPEWWKAEIKP